MSLQTNGLYEFGIYRLDAANRLLTRDTEPVTLAPKAFDLLLLLVASGGRLLGKQELMDALWPNTFVEEANLPFQIAGLRKVLGEKAAEWIEAVPKHGYRFTAIVTKIAGDGGKPDDLHQRGADVAVGAEVAPKPRQAAPRLVAAAIFSAAVVVFLAVARFGGWFSELRSDTATAHFVLSPPEGTTFALRLPSKPLVTVAPDGAKLALVAVDAAGTNSLWVRPLSAPSFQRIDGTEGASLAFWSPDSRFVAFFAGGKLKKVLASGGSPETICSANFGDRPLRLPVSAGGEGGTWNQAGVILFAQTGAAEGTDFEVAAGPLYRVAAAGGVAVPATKLDDLQGELSHSWPQFLPDGRHFLYLARNRDPERSRIYVQELGSQERRVVLNSKLPVVYAGASSGAGHVLFVREGVLLAQEFNVRRFELHGEPFAVATDISYGTFGGRAAFAASYTGVLVYRSGVVNPRTPVRQLAWYSREGRQLGPVGERGRYSAIALSPDETRAAIDRRNEGGDSDVWLLELASGIFSRLTSGPFFMSAAWAPDSRKIAVVAEERGKQQELREISVASGATAVLLADGNTKLLSDWTHDGRYLIYRVGTVAYRLPLTGERKPEAILNSASYKGRFKVSPDGHWIAYQSDETGKVEVYIGSFPAFDQKRQVSSGGGCEPLWRKDSKELFYLTLNYKLMAVEVKASSTLATGIPRLLFQTGIVGNPNLAQYAVTGDGQKFLAMEPVRQERTEQFHLILNWPEELKGRSAGERR